MPIDVSFDTSVSHELKKPRMYAVLLHNDDYTTMDFVVFILARVFDKSRADSQRLMMEVHNKGKSVVGVYPFDIAASKKILADRLANEREFPLKITIEEAEA